jgi:hypothetical protein
MNVRWEYVQFFKKHASGDDAIVGIQMKNDAGKVGQMKIPLSGIESKQDRDKINTALDIIADMCLAKNPKLLEEEEE